MGLFSDIGGAILNFIGGERANRATAKLVHDQMDFQQYMSNTSHQREVKDLLAAGLNPILSATGGSGASTPSGASAKMENTLEGAVSSAFQKKMLDRQIALIDAQTQDAYSSSLLKNQNVAESMQRTRGQELVNAITSEELKGAQVEGELDKVPIGELFKDGWRNTSVGEITRLLNRLFGGSSSAGSIMRLFGR